MEGIRGEVMARGRQNWGDREGEARVEPCQ